MKPFDPPHDQVPRTNWQILGQLKLSLGASPDGTMKEWLMNALRDFTLSGDLVSRLLASIEEAAAHILSPDRTQVQLEYLEIVVLAPTGQTSKGHTWGFFRVERESTDPQLESVKGHCVEYYLYLDSKVGK